MFGLSFTEIAIVAVLALLLFPPEQLPEMAKKLGKTLRDLRRTGDDLRRTFETEMVKMEDQINAGPARAAPKIVSLPAAAYPQQPLAPAAPLPGSAASLPEPLPEDVSPWLGQAERPRPAEAEVEVRLDQRSALEAVARPHGPRGEGPGELAQRDPQPLAFDPAAQRARLRRGALPLSPSALRAHVRSAQARAQEEAASAAAEVGSASAPQATAAGSTAAPAPTPASSVAAAPAPESPKARAAPPMTIPRKKKKGGPVG